MRDYCVNCLDTVLGILFSESGKTWDDVDIFNLDAFAKKITHRSSILENT